LNGSGKRRAEVDKKTRITQRKVEIAMTTTSKDLIDRFTAEAQRFKRLALVVVLEDQARLMWSQGPNLRIRLDSYLEAGGLPIGTIGYLDEPDEFQFRVEVLKELSDVPFIKKHLAALLDEIKAEWVEMQNAKTWARD
jgi:hypothetical protein